VLCIYGPFRRRGRHTAQSNERFDRELRARDPSSGLRDIEDVARVAAGCGLALAADHDLPANNRLLVFEKQSV
jgi:pyridoxine 5'-phosphate synthase PdxJ